MPAEITPEYLLEKSIDELAKEVFKNRFNIKKPMPLRPEYWISIKGDNGYEAGIALPGSIITVSGAEKVRKSALMGMFAASILSPTQSYENIVTSIDSGAIVWFDTEMSDIEFHQAQRSIYQMAGMDEVNPKIAYYGFPLRKYSDNERLGIAEILLNYVRETKGHEIKLIVIDGAVDLVSSANDVVESKSLLTTFARWADNYKATVMSAIHTNKTPGIGGKLTATGFLGAYLGRKCSYHFRVTMPEFSAPSEVATDSCRGGEYIKSFRFQHVDGVPKVLQNSMMMEDDDLIPEVFTTTSQTITPEFNGTNVMSF